MWKWVRIGQGRGGRTVGSGYVHAYRAGKRGSKGWKWVGKGKKKGGQVCKGVGKSRWSRRVGKTDEELGEETDSKLEDVVEEDEKEG